MRDKEGRERLEREAYELSFGEEREGREKRLELGFSGIGFGFLGGGRRERERKKMMVKGKYSHIDY